MRSTAYSCLSCCSCCDAGELGGKMLRYYWLPVNHYLLHLVGFSFIYLSKMHDHSKMKFKKWYCDSEVFTNAKPYSVDTVDTVDTYHCSCSTVPLLLEIPTYLLISDYHSCLHRIYLNPHPIPNTQFHRFYPVLLSTPFVWSEFVNHIFDSKLHSNSEETVHNFYKAVKLLVFMRKALCFEISAKI